MFQLKHIEALLEKYWEGETSLEEERLLKAYFASAEVDAGLRSFAPFFQVLKEEQAVQLLKKPVIADMRPQQYNWKPWLAAASVALLLAVGFWWIHRPATIDPYALQPINTPAPLTQPETTTVAETPQVAMETPASPVTPAKRKMIFRQKPNPSPQLNEEEEKAMEEIKAALALVSSKLKKGRQEAVKGTEHLDNMDRVFKKKKEGEG
jgi:hypothetical protein